MLFVLTACTGSGSDPSTATGPSSPGTTLATEETIAAAPATDPPIVLGVEQRLALRAGACFAEAPPPEPTTTTFPVTIPVTDELGVVITDASGSVVTEAPTTTLPASEPISVVDCAGSKLGEIYANGCLGVSPPDARVPVTDVPCPGIFEHQYPGSRLLDVAAAQFCLDRFEGAYGEPYATSELFADEWYPTAELWAIGDRRIVCTATPPEG